MTQTIGILGGTGFVGRSFCQALANTPCKLRVFTRRPEKHRELSVLPNLQLVQLDIHDSKDLAQGLIGCDIVVNLVGILNDTFDNSFEKIHIELVRHLIQICHKQGISRLLHISALNADPKAPSHYLRSKGEAEKLLNQSNHSHFHATIFRPSIIFGADDHFFNRFAHLLKWAPGMMMLPCAEAVYSPVYVEDVVHAMISSLYDKRTFEKTYELCGPESFTLKALLKMTADVMDKKRWILGLNPTFSKIAAYVLQLAPGKPLTPDQYLTSTVSGTCRHVFPDIFNIKPQHIKTILPQYIGDKALFDSYTPFRKMLP